jgi:hypothetical protein
MLIVHTGMAGLIKMSQLGPGNIQVWLVMRFLSFNLISIRADGMALNCVQFYKLGMSPRQAQQNRFNNILYKNMYNGWIQIHRYY